MPPSRPDLLRLLLPTNAAAGPAVRRVEQICLGVEADFRIVKHADAQPIRMVVHQIM